MAGKKLNQCLIILIIATLILVGCNGTATSLPTAIPEAAISLPTPIPIQNIEYTGKILFINPNDDCTAKTIGQNLS
jgi:uncharacterized lipoprotein YajG